MQEFSLVTVSWNNRQVLELMLKSYIKTHWHGNSLKIILFDNGSTDDTCEWLSEQQIPFLKNPRNIGHEQAINKVFWLIETKYCLFADTDLEFLSNIYKKYVPVLNDKCKLVGEYITKDQLNAPVKPRVGAWFMLTDLQAMKNAGVSTFRDKSDWSYDVGSQYTESVLEKGFTIHHIGRINSDIDRDVVGMQSDGFNHFGKLSWDLSKHMDREHEIKTRMNYIINERLPLYKDVDLRGKFTL